MAHRRESGAPRSADHSPQTYTCVRCPCSNRCRPASSTGTAERGMKSYSGHYVCTRANTCRCHSPPKRDHYNTSFPSTPRYTCYTYICSGSSCTLQNPDGDEKNPEAPPDEWEPEKAVSDTYIKTVYDTGDEPPSADYQETEPPTISNSQAQPAVSEEGASDAKADEPATYTSHMYIELKRPGQSATDVANPTPVNNVDSSAEVIAVTSDAADSQPTVHYAPVESGSTETAAAEQHIVLTVDPDPHSTKRGRFSVHAFPGKRGASKKGKNSKKSPEQVPSDQDRTVSRSPGHKLKPAKKKSVKPRKVKKLKKSQYPL